MVPVQKRLKAKDIAAATGRSARWVKAIRNGGTPSPELRERLTRYAADAIRARRPDLAAGTTDDLELCALAAYAV